MGLHRFALLQAFVNSISGGVFMKTGVFLIFLLLVAFLVGMPLAAVHAQEVDFLDNQGGTMIPNNEIIIGDRDDYLWSYENESGGVMMQFHTGYEKWDELVACDINGDGKDEIIQGDRSTDKIYAYDMYGNELFKKDVDFEEGDDLACMRTGRTFKLVFADRSEDSITIMDSHWAYTQPLGKAGLEELNDFEYGDSLAAIDADDDGSQEIILADHDENKLHIIDLDFSVHYSPIIYRASLDVSGYFDLTDRDEVSTGDVNFDGREELVIATQDNDNKGAKRGIHVFSIDYRNNAYSLRELSYFPMNFQKGDRMVVGDVNGDGLAEIVWASQSDGRVRVYSMIGDLLNGPNGFKTEFTYGAGLAVGDLNGDSIVVGPPNKATLHVVNQILAVINAPPVDYDAINESGTFYAEYTSKQTQTTTASIRATTDMKMTAELKFMQSAPGLVTYKLGLKTMVGQKLQRETGQSYETAITHKMLADMADGAIYVSTDYDVYEFPIISPPELAVINGKQQYVLVSIPKGPPNVHFQSYDSNLHEIGDINTYPTRITDLKNYDASRVLGVFTIEASNVQSSYEQYMRQLSWEKQANTFSVGVSLSFSGTLGSKVLTGFEGSVQGDYSHEKLTTHEVTFSNETSVLVAYEGRIDEGSKWYNATGVIYTDSEDGHLVLDFYVPSKGSYYEARELSPIFINFGLFRINLNALKALNNPPECSIGATPNSGKMPLEVGFNLNFSDPENGSVRWELDFGDGATLEGNYTELRHVYTGEGTYRLSLTVYDIWNANSTCSATINVEPNERPEALFSYSPAELRAGDEVSFVDSSSDPDGSVVSWSWNFGDGNFSDERNPRHVYSSPGVYTVMLTVEDESGLRGSYYKEITVQPRNYLPTADFTFLPKEPKAGEEVSFADKSYDRDGSIVSWSWDFGDGATSGEAEPTHTFSSPGNYTVTLTVRDEEGGEDVRRITITVSEVTPATTTETESSTTTTSTTQSTSSTATETGSPPTTPSSETASQSSTPTSNQPSPTESGGTCGPGIMALVAVLAALFRRR